MTPIYERRYEPKPRVWWFLSDPLDWLYAAAVIGFVYVMLNVLGGR